MIGFGQDVPDTPTVGSDKVRILRARLDAEEVLEYANDAALQVRFRVPKSSIVEHVLGRVQRFLTAKSNNETPDIEPSQLLEEVEAAIRSYADDWLEPVIFNEKEGNVVIERDFTKVPNLAKMIDALSDMSVVNTGAAVAFGVRLEPMLELTDANNMMKLANGHLDEFGKFIKPKNHPVPNYEFALAIQGYVPEEDVWLQKAIQTQRPSPLYERPDGTPTHENTGVPIPPREVREQAIAANAARVPTNPAHVGNYVTAPSQPAASPPGSFTVARECLSTDRATIAPVFADDKLEDLGGGSWRYTGRRLPNIADDLRNQDRRSAFAALTRGLVSLDVHMDVDLSTMRLETSGPPGGDRRIVGVLFDGRRVDAPVAMPD